MRIETSFGFDHERTQGALLWRGSREEYEAYTREHPIIRLANEPLLTPAIEALLESTGCQMLSDESIRLASREQTNYLQERIKFVFQFFLFLQAFSKTNAKSVALS